MALDLGGMSGLGALAGAGIALMAVFLVVLFVLNAVLLWLTAKIFKVGKGWGIPFGIAAIALVAGWLFGFLFSYVPLVGWLLGWLAGAVLNIFLVKTFYKLGLGKALLVWLVWAVFVFIVSFVLGLLALLVVGGAALAGGLRALA